MAKGMKSFVNEVTLQVKDTFEKKGNIMWTKYKET